MPEENEGWLSWLTNWGGWFSSFVTWGASAAAAVFWTLIGQHLVCWLQWMFCWAAGVLFLFFVQPMLVVLKLLPTFPSLVVDSIGQVWLMVDVYFPLSESVLWSFLVFGAIGMFRIFRFCKQFAWGSSN